MLYCDKAYVAQTGGGAGLEATLELAGCVAADSQDDGIFVGSDAIVNATGTFCERTLLPTGHDVHLDASTSQFYGAGNRIRGDLISLSLGGTIVSEAINTKSGDEGVDIVGELHVGTYQVPS